jgi:hypothetical protein
MWRWMLHGAALLSLLTFVSVVILWPSVGPGYDGVCRGEERSAEGIARTDWLLMGPHALCWSTSVIKLIRRDRPDSVRWKEYHSSDHKLTTFWTVRRTEGGFEGLGFRYESYPSSGHQLLSRLIELPYWLILAASTVAPCLDVRRSLRAWKRRSQGLCLRCGYDLRASTERCPECGTPIPANPTS